MHESKISVVAWCQLMAEFGLGENTDMYDQLISAYSEKHRAYHSLDHIKACFGHLEAVIQECHRPHEIELALWFHDMVYKPLSSTNEEDSADLARSFLSKHAVSAEIIRRVYDLIVLTKDHCEPASDDARFMLDIDLSILGTQATVYAKYEKDIRQEYKRVPSILYKRKRKEILKSFLARPRLYHSCYFYDRFEVRARENLVWAIKKL